MAVTIADCGSTWVKILDVASNRLEIIPTKELVRRRDPVFDIATGHSGRNRCKRYKNELIALAEGGLSMIDAGSFSLVDVGGRDIKFVRFKDRKVDKLDWNLVCGSTTGATVELLVGYYGLGFGDLVAVDDWITITCGVFGMERVLEAISNSNVMSTKAYRSSSSRRASAQNRTLPTRSPSATAGWRSIVTAR